MTRQPLSPEAKAAAIADLRKKRRAYYHVQQALRNGSLTRPLACERCAKTPGPTKNGRSGIEAHHHLGYDYPVDVEWLCTPCHSTETPRHKLKNTHCPVGHEYAGKNLRLMPRTDGGFNRCCRECLRKQSRLRYLQSVEDLNSRMRKFCEDVERRKAERDADERAEALGKIADEMGANV